MKRTVISIIAGALVLAACGGGSVLSADQEQWCWDNSEIVGDAAGDLGLLDFVDVYYEKNGDGIGSNGEPEFTTRNVELSEELKRRNASDGEALFNDLFETYLTHADGQKACIAAHAEES